MGKDFTDFFMEMIQSQKVKKSYTEQELEVLEKEYLKVYFEKVKSEKIKPRKKLKI